MRNNLSALLVVVAMGFFVIFSLSGMFYCQNLNPCFYSPDSYYYFHEAQNVVRGDFSRDSFAWVEYCFHWVVSIFYPVSLAQSISAFSVVLGCLSLLLVYFIVRKIHSSEAGIFAAFLFCTNYLMLFVFRWGYGDIEFLLVFLLLCFLLLFVHVEGWKFNWLICLVFLVCLTLFWDGFFFLSFIAFVSFLVYFVLSKKISIAFVFAFAGAIVIFATMQFQKIVARLFVHSYFISELAGMGLLDFAQSVGILLVFSFIGVYYLRGRFKELNVCFLLVYFVLGIVLCFLISRMLYFLMVGLIILAGISLAELSSFIVRKTRLDSGKWLLYVILLAVIAVFFVPNAILVSGILPIYGGGDYASADAIYDYAIPGTVISWWDEGNFYYALSGQPVALRAFPRKDGMDTYMAAMSGSDDFAVVDFKRLCNCSSFYVVVSGRVRGYLVNLSNESFFYHLVNGEEVGCFAEIVPGVWHYYCG